MSIIKTLITFVACICQLLDGIVIYELGSNADSTFARLNEKRRMLAQSKSISEAPLFRGYGTHFVYLWVGTPPQRVSVIVDSGSQHTAFPCTGVFHI
jgi:hypothetical protein